MDALVPPDTHFASAVLGWLELGNLDEAKAELARLSPLAQRHPDVLEIRWMIHAEEKAWADGLKAACDLLAVAPQRCSGWLHRAYALRRVKDGGLEAARDALLPAVEQFPEEPTVPYNLACYACQLEQMDEARRWLERALKSGGKDKIRRMALNDDDLRPLWTEIERM